MSSEYDEVIFGDDVSLPDFTEDVDPSEAGFQSKTLPDAFCLREVRVTQDGLLVEHFEIDFIPVEERSEIKDKKYGNTKEEELPVLEDFLGSMEKVSIEFVDKNYDGKFRFYSTVNGKKYEYEGCYTDGKLDEIRRV
jgi:hypothetical protein